MTLMRRNALQLVTVLCAVTAVFGQGKLASDLSSLKTTHVNVIVQYAHAPTESHHRKIRDRGGELLHSFNTLLGSTYKIPVSALNDLANDPEVVFVSPDRLLTPTLDIAAATINATAAAQYGYDGSGVGVAVIDSGISPHADFPRGAEFHLDLAGGGVQDAYGHGTHVAGIIAGTGRSSSNSSFFRTFQGIAPGVSLIDLRVLDKNGSGTDSSVIVAIEAAIFLKNFLNIRVINLSLGRPVYESYKLDPLCQAVENAWKAGIVVVVAAGNSGRDNSVGTSGYGTIGSPGNDPYVITVGAMKTAGTTTRSDDTIASYSSKGPTLYDHIAKPDIVAPGNRTISLRAATASLAKTYPQTLVAMNVYQHGGRADASPDYLNLSGTSMAAPMVSGAVALILQKFPQLTPDRVKARLMKTASKSFPAYSNATDPVTGTTYTSQYDIFTIGAGYLDIAAALDNSDNTTGTAISPTAGYSGGKVTLNYDSTAVWNKSVTWGSSVIWGSNVFMPGTSNLWGSSVVWGTGTMKGFSVVWGSSVVWGTGNQTSAESINVAVNGEN